MKKPNKAMRDLMSGTYLNSVKRKFKDKEALVSDIKVRLDQVCYVILPVTLLSSMDELIVRVGNRPKKRDGRLAGTGLKNYTLGFDDDGLLSVRGIEGEDRWNPVLTNSGRWVRRSTAQGITDVREIELDCLTA